MGETNYVVELARSGRSKCGKCKSQIEKGEIRIGSVSTKGDDDTGDCHSMTSWKHAECFNLPRKYTSGPEKMTAEDFVCNVLEDTSADNSILPEKAGELAAKIASKKAKKKDGEEAAVDGVELIVNKLKKAYEERLEREGDDDDDDEPAPKKAKTDESARLDAYGIYHTMNVEEGKDYMRWNKQTVGGKKKHLLVKCIDGHCNGRLARCPLDGGKLSYKEDGETVICAGYFDEDMGRHISCTFKTTIKEAPRWQLSTTLPTWFTSAPTEEQAEEMERMIEASKGGGEVVDISEDADLAELAIQAEAIDMDLSNRGRIKEATKAILDLFKKHPKQLDISDDQKEAMTKVGPIVIQHQDDSPSELIIAIVNEVGFKEDKEQKAAKKKVAMKSASAHPANAPIAAAFHELATLISKEGDRNRAGSYFRATEAINTVDYEITAENAIGLSKGKTKVKNIGKSSAEKILEFLTEGKIEKLEELRASAS